MYMENVSEIIRQIQNDACRLYWVREKNYNGNKYHNRAYESMCHVTVTAVRQISEIV